jgi:uncharacterized membrane protein
MNTSQSLIICAFDGAIGNVEVDVARTALGELSSKIAELNIAQTATVQKNANGEITVHEPGEAQELLEDVAGAIAKGTSWLLYNVAGMLGPLAGVSAETQAKLVVDRFVKDSGFPDAALHDLGERLNAGQTALILIVDAEDRGEVVQVLQELHGHVIDHDLPTDLVTRLRQ